VVVVDVVVVDVVVVVTAVELVTDGGGSVVNYVSILRS
jgi:hypothetical protein